MQDRSRPHQVDGVVVHHLPGPAGSRDTSVQLIFAVGGRDERFHERGALHAVEHLVMDQVRSLPVDANASVGPTTNEFTASGPVEPVATSLAGVCRGLADLPTGRWPAEAEVLGLELASAAPDPAGPLRRVRYGNRDLGADDAPRPRPQGLTVDALRSHADRWFTAGNAQLIIDGAMPPELRLPLRPGTAPARRWPAPRRFARPGAVLVDGPGCAVGLVLPAPDPSGLSDVLAELLLARATQAVRHERGLSYVVDGQHEPAADGRVDLVIHAEPGPRTLEGAVQVLTEATLHLLRRGPSAAELTYARDRVRHERQSRFDDIRTAVAAGLSERLGVPVGPVPVTAPEPSDADVSAALAALEPDLLVLADLSCEALLGRIGLEVVEPGTPVTAPPAGRTFSPPLMARVLNAEARRARVVLSDDGVALLDPAGIQVVRFADVVGVLREEDGDVAVFGADGAVIPIGPFRYRQGSQLIDALRRRVAPELFFDSDDLEVEPPT